MAPQDQSAKVPIDEDQIQLVALYGIGTRISAELRYKGWTQTVVSGSLNVRIGPWLIEEITPARVTLVRPAVPVSKAKSKKVGARPERLELYYASEAPDPVVPPAGMSARPAGLGMISLGAPMMPPAPPGVRVPVPALPQAYQK
jgi:hypothetical protein